MGRRARPAACALAIVGVALAGAPSVPAATRASGAERFDGGLVLNGASGQRKVAGSVVAASGVFNGVGRIVERPNKPGESEKVLRDDFVFAAGVMHVRSEVQKASVVPDPRTCVVTFTITQTGAIEGGNRRFAHATGTFKGKVTGSGIGRRKADGSCDQRSAALAEVDNITAVGTLSF